MLSELLKHIEYMKWDLTDKNIPAEKVYLNFKKLLELNASDKQIADIAFEYHNLWNEPTESAYYAIYDLALLEEEGFERNREEINEIIEQIVL